MGSEFLVPGDGNDRVSNGAKLPAAYVNGEGGNDLMQGGDFDDTLTGGPGKNGHKEFRAQRKRRG